MCDESKDSALNALAQGALADGYHSSEKKTLRNFSEPSNNAGEAFKDDSEAFRNASEPFRKDSLAFRNGSKAFKKVSF